MSEYRAYIMGVDGHRFIKAAGFLSDYPDDGAALRAAERLVSGHDIELWDRARLVARMGQTSTANAMHDEKVKALRSAVGSVDLGGKLSVDGASVRQPAPQTPDQRQLKAGSTHKRHGGWHVSRKTMVAIARLFHRKGVF